MNQSMRTLKGVRNYASLLLAHNMDFSYPFNFFFWVGGQSILLCLVTLLKVFFTDNINICTKKNFKPVKIFKRNQLGQPPLVKDPPPTSFTNLVNLFIFSLNRPHWADSVNVKREKKKKNNNNSNKKNTRKNPKNP